jgi:hypothetical protein
LITASLALLEALRTGEASQHGFLYLDHLDGPVRVWTGTGTVSWDGEDWLGVGILGAISGVEQTAEITAHELSFTLSGIDPRVISLTTGGVRNRDAVLYARWVSRENVWFPDSVVLWKGLMDHLTSREDDGQAVIELLTRSPLANWDQAPNVAYTHEEQQLYYSGDTGLDRIVSLANKTTAGWLGP